MYRHGDVLVAPIDAVPKEAKRRQHLVLAHGEATGHSHRVGERGAAELYELHGVLYMNVVAQPATLVHEEHGPISLPLGAYRVWRQDREYTPREIRIVRD